MSNIVRALICLLLLSTGLIAQESLPFKVGEKVTYNILFEKSQEVGFIEAWLASKGKFRNEDALELRFRVATTNLLDAIYPINREQICIMSSKSGIPLYTRTVFNEEAIPREVIQDAATSYHSLLTAIYQIRAGANNIVFQENDRSYTLSWQSNYKTRLRTDIGEFETSRIEMQSSYFDELGLKKVQMYITEDERRLPVMVRFTSQKGNFTISIASLQIKIADENDVIKENNKTPDSEPSQTLQPTPKPTVKPTPYVENQPLSSDLPFSLGETLLYEITLQTQKIATVTLQVKERKLFKGKDAVLLMAEVTQSSSTFNKGDYFMSWIDPNSLIPMSFEAKLSGNLSGYSQSIEFEQDNGLAFNSSNSMRFEIPVGTHSMLSLAYALRTFKLQYQKNKLSDIRVAVLFKDKYSIVTFRPISQEPLEFDGRKIETTVVSIRTGNQKIDQAGAKVWLSNDDARLPLQFTFGKFTARLKKVQQ